MNSKKYNLVFVKIYAYLLYGQAISAFIDFIYANNIGIVMSLNMIYV